MVVNMNNDSVISSRIRNFESLNFIDDLAVAEIEIKSVDFYNNRVDYVGVSVIKRTKGKDGSYDYALASETSKYFHAEKFVDSIERIGNDFFVNYVAGEENVSWDKHKHYRYRRIAGDIGTFDFIAETPGRIRPTKDSDVAIVGKSQLYSVKDAALIGESYSSIEETEGELFLVVDTIASKVNKDIRDNFVFCVDKSGNIVGDILSRNDGMKVYERDENEPYLEILTRRRSELDEVANKEKDAIQELKLGKKSTK